MLDRGIVGRLYFPVYISVQNLCKWYRGRADLRSDRRCPGAVGSRDAAVGFAAMPDRDPDCLFCKIVAGEIPGTIVAEDERTVAFMDINPAHARPRARRPAPPRRRPRRDLERGPRRRRRRGPAPGDPRHATCSGADGVNLINCCGPRRVADGLPPPRPRDPALRGRPAAAAVEARAGRRGRDRRRRRRAPRGLRRGGARDARARRRARVLTLDSAAAEPLRRGDDRRAAGGGRRRRGRPAARPARPRRGPRGERRRRRAGLRRPLGRGGRRRCGASCSTSSTPSRSCRCRRCSPPTRCA